MLILLDFLGVELLAGPSLGFLIAINWSKFALKKTLFVNKYTIKMCFSTF